MIFELYMRTCIVDECKMSLGPELQEINSSLNELAQRGALILTAKESLCLCSHSVNCCQEDPAPLPVLSKIPSITDRRRECGHWKSIGKEELQEPEVWVEPCSRVDL